MYCSWIVVPCFMVNKSIFTFFFVLVNVFSVPSLIWFRYLQRNYLWLFSLVYLLFLQSLFHYFRTIPRMIPVVTFVFPLKLFDMFLSSATLFYVPVTVNFVELHRIHLLPFSSISLRYCWYS